ncbi:hypothetical protein [Streptomyces sp. NPDC051994]|uniref:hypothetical protein n=1 Tax=unclassified Streptomyces TaxID=2593676 RepID=UPI00341518CC
MITGAGIAEFFGVGLFLTLLALGVRATWTLTCWIAERPQRRNDRREAARRTQLETAAIRHLGDRLHTHPNDAIDGELDHHLDQYADSIQALYPTGEQQ